MFILNVKAAPLKATYQWIVLFYPANYVNSILDILWNVNGMQAKLPSWEWDDTKISN